MAKLIIKLINSVAAVVNHDPAVRDGSRLCSRTTTSERSTSSGRGPERTDLDGRQGSLGHGQHEIRHERRADDRHADGANVEIREHVGGENFFLFGLTAEQVDAQSRRLPAATTTGTPNCAASSTTSPAARWPAATHALPPDRRESPRSRSLPRARRLRGVCRRPGPRERCGATSTPGPASPF